MSELAALRDAFNSTLRKEGFSQRGQSWYLQGIDSVVVINLQRYRFDDLYFANFGIWLNALGANDFPDENKCHIRDRLEYLFPDKRDLVIDALKISSCNDYISKLREFLEMEVVPFCRKCLLLNTLTELIAEGRFAGALFVAETKIVLELTAKKSR